MNIFAEECAAPPRTSRMFHYECPKCKHKGSSNNLIMGWLCPNCKTDFFLAHERRKLESDAIRQTVAKITLLTGSFYERSLDG